MKIVLFRPFPDPYRFSIKLYASAIETRVRPWLKPGETIGTEELPGARLRGWRFVREHAGDVNHIVDTSFAHLARSLPRGRTIVTFHDMVVTKVPGSSWTTRLSFRYALTGLRRAAAVVCHSENARKRLSELVRLPAERVHVIPLGIDETFRPPAERAAVRKQLGFSTNVVLLVEHTQPYMNVERMLQAFGTLLSQHHLDAELVKIGLPFTPEQIHLIRSLGLTERVRMAGPVGQDELRAYYQAADLLLYAPLHAGFGLPPFEAMACGTPVVASSRGAMPEVVGDAAVCVDADDPAAMGSAMADVLTNPVRRRRLVDAGFERAGRFEWSETCRRLVNLYRAVCS